MHLGAVQLLSRIFRNFLEFILIFLELFLFIRRLYFHELQISYLDCSYFNLPLGIFLEFLELFRVFFVPLKQFLDFLELFLH
jgi:hypothetical protein